MKENIIQTVNNILSAMFPYKEPTLEFDPFIRESWLDKVMQSPKILDYLWTPSKKN